MDTELQDRILNSLEKDNDIRDTLETIMKDSPMALQNNLSDWKLDNVDGRRAIFYKGKNYIPQDQEI